MTFTVESYERREQRRGKRGCKGDQTDLTHVQAKGGQHRPTRSFGKFLAKMVLRTGTGKVRKPAEPPTSPVSVLRLLVYT
jgi:hypothetical protein